ncbi:hypothetical protein LTR74_007667 [Friedmanniomyces endolithicus]|nr:hypothetical protein LTR74_007667 [Friedmanniomyces endolithicus]
MEIATNPVFHPTKPTKIILSPGHGAGWGEDKLETLLTRFHAEAATLFAIDRIVTSRVGDLFVLEMSVPFEIRENEGQERVVDVSRRREVMVSPVTVAAETSKIGAGISGVGGSASPPPPTPSPTPLQPTHQPPLQFPQAPQPVQVPRLTAPIQPEQPVPRGVTAAVAAARSIASPLLLATSGKPSQQTTQPEQPVSRGLPPTAPARGPPKAGAKKSFERA